MEIKIYELELPAQDGQSKIYRLYQCSILRVPQREIDCGRIKYEYEVNKLIQDKITLPHVNGFLEIDKYDVPQKLDNNLRWKNLKL